MSTLLDKMHAKLARLEAAMLETFATDPRNGHGGTPTILDNSKGRQMHRVCQRVEERRQSLNRQIKEQREKIERQKSREAYRATQTKKSAAFIAKNPISPVLFKLQEAGKVKQWPRNPQLFFVVGLQKVALITVGDKVGVCKKYPAKTREEFDLCQQMIAEAA